MVAPSTPPTKTPTTPPVGFRAVTAITPPVPVELPAARRKRAGKPHEPPEGNKALKGLVQPEAQQHADYVIRLDHVGRRRGYNTTECNMDVYYNRGSITREQRDAGMTLYRAFRASRLISGIKSCLNVTVGGRGTPAGLNFQAYESFQAAIASIRGQRVRKLTINVCCIGEWLKDVNNLRIPLHRRMEAFTRALDDLIAHYETRINAKRALRSFNASLTTTMGPPDKYLEGINKP